MLKYGAYTVYIYIYIYIYTRHISVPSQIATKICNMQTLSHRNLSVAASSRVKQSILGCPSLSAWLSLSTALSGHAPARPLCPY